MVCTYCGSAPLQRAFVRNGRDFVTCKRCGAFHGQRPVGGVLNQEYYEDGSFVGGIEEDLGDDPDAEKLAVVRRYLKPGSLLEIGPGTGHFLAAARAAGFSVHCIEPSPYHREYIRAKWGIATWPDPLEDNALPAAAFDSVISFNCIEHTPDPMAHVAAAYRVVRPGGIYLVSTCNGASLLRRVTGRYWAMFKPPDHVSIPTPRSLLMVGRRCGFTHAHAWTSEYPLETPIGILIALYDYVREQRRAWQLGQAGADVVAAQPNFDQLNSPEVVETGSAARVLLRRLRKASTFSWASACTSHFMAAGAVHVVYYKPQTTATPVDA